LGGSGGLTMNGGGAVTLSSANTYTGATNIDAGTLNLNNAGALPTASGLTLGNAVAFSSSGTSSSFVTFAGSNPFFFTGTATLNGAVNSSAVYFSIGNTGGVTLAGQVAGASPLAVTGGGTLYLTNAFGAASNFSGILTVLSGMHDTQQAN